VGGWPVWSLQFAIAVFVVACPCGIGLAAPTALFVGSGLAAKQGILARGGGEAFQEGARVDVVCFDKTGTLTEGGDPQIVDIECEEPDEMVKFAYALEGNSNHPLAIAVRRYAEMHGLNGEVEIGEIIDIPGNGVSGTINGQQVILGNERLMEQHGVVVTNNLKETLHKWKRGGKSVILVAVLSTADKWKLVLAMSCADKIRPEASSVIGSLQKRGIDCWMISGDNEVTAKAVAGQIGIPEDQVIAGVLPEEKSDKIAWLQKTANSKRTGAGRAIVAMVGDGVNDAPSLATADVGIAIGSGSDLALSSAKFVLLKSNLLSLLDLFDISRVVFRRIKFNFGWALVYNLIGVPIAAGVIYPYHNSRLDPVWASLAMALSSISVVTSSLLLKFHKPEGQRKQELDQK
jgi:Cu+-exporting ATPase